MSYKVKLCGTTSVEDGLLAEQYGADYVGILLEVPYSERSVSLAGARSIVASLTVPSVVLTYCREPEWVTEAVRSTGAFAVQLLGDESPEDVAELRRRLNVADLSCVEIWKSLFLPASDENLPPPPMEEVLRQMRELARAGADKLLLDTVAVADGRFRHGGTGKTNDWKLAGELVRASPLPTFLSGGISPENVVEAVRLVRPFGVDLCSGVEARRGKRDVTRTAALFANLRAAE